MMEVASTSKTSVNFCQTTRRKIPEDCHLHTCRRENMKPQRDGSVVMYDVQEAAVTYLKELYEKGGTG
jgi:hypothetical protein